MQTNSAMVLLDDNGQWDGDARVVAHWNELNVIPNQESIPQKVEKEALSIKIEYLAWVYDLGQYKVHKQTLTSYLQFFENLSFWWMTKIAAKSPFLSPGIYQVFKLRALEKLYFEKKCVGLIYCGNNKIMHQIFHSWCRKLGHPYTRTNKKRCHNKSEWTGIKKYILNLPYCFQAFLYFTRRWFMVDRHTRPTDIKNKQNNSKNNVTIITYFPNIDMGKANEGRFYSHYWGSIHELLDELPYTVNWVWMYSKSDQVKYKDAISIRDKCNQYSPEKYRHFLLDEFCTPKIAINCIKHYLKLYLKGLRLKEVQTAFSFPGSKINFFPILKHDWNSSLFGKDAIEGIMYAFLFDSMTKTLPANPWGLFLLENQPHQSFP
mgnify:CR=1 FL=1